MNQPPPIHFDGPKNATATFAFAHGAGVGMESEFIEYFANRIAATGIRVARFEFPYMQKRREDGKKRPPDRGPVLLETWRAVIEELGAEKLFVGGKSMGGRIASMVAAELEKEERSVAGCICLGYPFHAPGKPDKVRIEHLLDMATPTLILQGTRDPFGTLEEVPTYPLSKNVSFHWLEDGEHSFKPSKASGRTEEQNWDEAIETLVAFVKR